MKALEILKEIKSIENDYDHLKTHKFDKAIEELELIKNSKPNTLFEYDLETNFNGYPFENIAYDLADEVKDYFIRNEFTRFHKNKKYKLVLTLEEY